MAKFLISLVDDGGLEGIVRNSSLEFVLKILPVNQAPGFVLSSTCVVIDEDSGLSGFHRFDDFATNISADNSDLDTEPEQSYTFDIAVTVPELFASGDLPAISKNGKLSFRTAKDEFGESVVTVRLRDNGGIVYGGADVSADFNFTISILPVNDAPSFALYDMTNGTYTVPEGSGSNRLQAMIDIVPGPANEQCLMTSAPCDGQSVTFSIEDITNPTLFTGQPHIHADGVLVFNVAEERTGSSFLSVRLQDDGRIGRPDNSSFFSVEYHDRVFSSAQCVRTSRTSAGENTSKLYTLQIKVQADDDEPSFALPWNVSCSEQRYVKSGLCTCSGRGSGNLSDACKYRNQSSDSFATIRVLESSGQHMIDEFAAEVTTAKGFFNRAVSRFVFDKQSRTLEFVGLQEHDVNLYSQLEYASHETMSPDGQHLYVAEQDNDVISVYSSRDKSGKSSQIPPNQRLFDRMQRFRFSKSPINMTSGSADRFNDLELDYVTGLDSFDMGNNTLLVASTGAQLLWENEDHKSNSTCNIHLTQDCDGECCTGLLDDTLGLWDLSSSSLFGLQNVNHFKAPYQVHCDEAYCKVNRTRNSECGEFNAISIGPAAFKDQANRLGSAVLVGSSCNSGPMVDWGNPSSDEVLSAATLIMNDGNIEAMQFDGVLNSGLYVTNDIDPLVNVGKLPVMSMSLSIWFASASTSAGVYGLIGAAQDSIGCRKGFILTYTIDNDLQIMMTFQVALEKSTDGIPSTVSTEPVPFSRNAWTHLIATYDGSSLHLFVDGTHVASTPGCLYQSCGRIEYPSKCAPGETPLTIGAFENSRLGLSFIHHGAIKIASLIDRAVSQQEAKYMFDIYADSLRTSPLTTTEYWAKNLGLLDGIRSPDRDFGLGRKNDTLTLKGRFSVDKHYICKFSYGKLVVNSTALTQCSDESKSDLCSFQYVDELQCTTPHWIWGFKAAILSVAYQNGAIFTPIWQRACITKECGYVTATDRSASTGTLGKEGTFTHFRFTTESLLCELDHDAVRVLRISNMDAASRCVDTVCRFQDLIIQGANSFTHFSVGSRDFLLAANFWDGKSTSTSSPLFELNMTGGIQKSMHLQFLQSIDTHGARKWQRIHVNSTDYLVLAAYSKHCPVYRWSSHEQKLVDSNLSLPASWASDVISFTYAGIVYVVVSSFRDGESGLNLGSLKVFAIGNAANSTHSMFGFDESVTAKHLRVGLTGISARLVDSISIYAPVDLHHYEIDGVQYLAVASYGAPLLVFMIAEAPSRFAGLNLVQSISPQAINGSGDEVFYATSMQFFRDADPFLIIATAKGNAFDSDRLFLLRWNGSQFLGPADERTQTKDLAGGQILPADSPFSLSVFKGDKQERIFMMVASRSLGAVLYEGNRINVGPMDGPGPMQFSPDGRFLYVGCFYSRNIAVFQRDAADDGRLSYRADSSLTTPWSALRVTEMNAADPSKWSLHELGFPLRSISSMAMSPSGRHLYVSSFTDNATAVYDRSDLSGALSLIQVISDGVAVNDRIIDGLAQPTALSLSSDGGKLYVCALVDQSISTFDVLADGTLIQSDRLKNGERLFWRFNDKTLDSSEIATSHADYKATWSNGNFPTRLGGNGHPWSFSATDSRHFVIEGMHFVVVTHSNRLRKWGSVAASTAVIYKWDKRSKSFEQFQELMENAYACSVSQFSMRRKNGAEWHYVVIGNEVNPPDLQSQVNIYEWQADSGIFSHHHSLTFKRDRFFPANYASSSSDAFFISVKLKDFFVNDTQYLAVAGHSDGSTDAISANIYRWNASNGRTTQVDSFVLHKLIPSSNLNDMDFGYFAGIPLLFLANRPPERRKSSSFDGNVKVYEVSNGEFFELQTISGHEPSDVEVISIQAEGDFIAVANRQSRAPNAEDDQSAYDQASELYRWNATTRLFQLHQRFDSSFMSVVDDSATASDVFEFCKPNCASTDGSTQSPVPGLRGATSFTAFMADGENYLAVAQSVCEADLGRLECQMPQPKSAILQFNRITKQYGELLSITSADYQKLYGQQIPDDELEIHQYAFRINAGRAVGFEYMQIGDYSLLLLCSLTRGAVVFEWDFEKVIGLHGAVAVESADNHLYVLSQQKQALVALEESIRHDDVGMSVQECKSGCIQFVDAISETPINFDRKRKTSAAAVRGLRGASRISISAASASWAGDAVGMEISGTLPKDQFKCSVRVPVSPTPTYAIINNREVYGLDSSCQSYSFMITSKTTNNFNLFQEPPTLNQDGALTFLPRPHQAGQATFQVVLQESSGLITEPKEFSIEVLAVNNIPSFLASDILVNVNSSVTQKLIFAVNVTAGEMEAEQSLQWKFSYTNKNLFQGEPQLDVAGENGSFFGMIQFKTNETPGSSNFTVRLIDDGSSDIMKGDMATSSEQSFRVHVRARNIHVSSTSSCADCSKSVNMSSSWENATSLNVSDVGPDISDDMPEADRLCSGHGSCSDAETCLTGRCLCDAEWAGINCSQSIYPSFDMPESYFAVEAFGNHSVPLFASLQPLEATSKGPLPFTFVTSFTSSQHNLFTLEPEITPLGTLRFASSTHGRAAVQVHLKVCSTELCDVTERVGESKQFSLIILPTPRVHFVTPQIVPLMGNVRVTVTGKFFGSVYSRGYFSPSYGNFSIFFGNDRCNDEVYISDEKATCLVSSGVGVTTVTFNIADAELSRSGSLSNALVHAQLLYGGSTLGFDTSGFLGYGPTSVSPGTFSMPSASIGDVALNISRCAQSKEMIQPCFADSIFLMLFFPLSSLTLLLVCLVSWDF